MRAEEAVDTSLFKYDILAEDPETHARAGVLHTPHGDVPTPIFMPVGTKATVKGLMPSTLRELGTKILLANTYHLSMRPGADLVAEMGGLHDFMRWDGPILTDSGGFQVFSHEEFCRLSDDGVRFRAVDYDGRWISWTPEDNMEIAQKLGADIVMQLDQCVGYPAPRAKVARSVELSSRWAERCYAAHTRPDQALFGIVQGGMHLDLRLRSLAHLEECGDFPGYGIGGYSVGEDHETMFETLAPLVSEHMPVSKPRYLMGVGNPTTLVRAVACGVDMFDCVLPTRTARTGSAFFERGAPQLPPRALRARPAPDRRGVHLPRLLAGLLARLPAPSRPAARDARRNPHLSAQHPLPAQPHAPSPRGRACRHLCGVRERLDGLARRLRLVAPGEASGPSATIVRDQQTGRGAPGHERTDMSAEIFPAPVPRAGSRTIRITTREGR